MEENEPSGNLDSINSKTRSNEVDDVIPSVCSFSEGSIISTRFIILVSLVLDSEPSTETTNLAPSSSSNSIFTRFLPNSILLLVVVNYIIDWCELVNNLVNYMDNVVNDQLENRSRSGSNGNKGVFSWLFTL